MNRAFDYIRRELLKQSKCTDCGVWIDHKKLKQLERNGKLYCVECCERIYADQLFEVMRYVSHNIQTVSVLEQQLESLL